MRCPECKKHKDNTEMTLAWLLRDIHQMAQTRLAQNLVRYGLFVGQPRILRLIHDHPGETQKQIADRLYVSGASLSISLKRLQKANLVEKRQSKLDRRRHELYLTLSGEKAIEKCSNDLRSLYGNMMSGLSHEEVQQLLGSLKTIHETLISMPDNSADSVQIENSVGTELSTCSANYLVTENSESDYKPENSFNNNTGDSLYNKQEDN